MLYFDVFPIILSQFFELIPSISGLNVIKLFFENFSPFFISLYANIALLAYFLDFFYFYKFLIKYPIVFFLIAIEDVEIS